MSDYDFSSLNDKDFEELVVDLLSAEFGQRVERFKPGKDAGVDGRFFSGKDETIIQCKHWLKSGISTLIASLSKTELPKVKKLAPNKYFLATSLSLTRHNKSQIQAIFKDFMDDGSFILGKEDLNDLLKKYSQIERNHYKLWISSTTVLETIMNSDVLGRSTYKLKEIKEGSNKYVITQNHNDAIHKLEEVGSVIISGLPGIGKTTLADQVCKHYLALGFEFYYIEDSITSIEKVYKEDVKQIYYFDDFLGSNYLEGINNNEDSKIAAFFRRIERDKSKRFILTSRTNILNQGKRLSTAFDVQNINRNEYEIVVENLKDLDKAKILYNHIFHSNLPEEFIDELYVEERYRIIINHTNFNPRLISFITDYQRLLTISKEDYWEYIESTLENPSLVWSNVFDRQIDNISKDIVCIVVLNKGRVLERQLEEIYYKICSESESSEVKTFNFIMRALTGSLLNRHISDREVYYGLFNPSIIDFVIQNYFRNKYYVLNLLKISDNLKSFENIVELYKNNLLSESNFIFILKGFIAEKIDKKSNDLDFIKILNISVISGFVDEELVSGAFYCLGDFTKYDQSYYCSDFFELILFMVESKGVDSFVDFPKFLEKSILPVLDDFYLETLSVISKIVNILNIDENHNFYKGLKDLVIEYLSQEITSMVIQDNVIDGIYTEEEFEEDTVSFYIEDYLASNFNLKFAQGELDQIYWGFNLDDAIQANMNSSYDPDFDGRTGATYSGSYDNIDPIGDLFDRS